MWQISNRMNELLADIINSQTPEGGFPSCVHFQKRILPDTNGFITALTLRQLAQISYTLPESAIQKSLDFIESCQSATRKGIFNFYPPKATPMWIQELPDDVDDTVIIGLELLRHGRIDRAFAIKYLAATISNFRLRKIDAPAPVWLKPGVFFTWLQANGQRNMVDCCVNANVIALYSFLGLTHWQGYAEACQMIEEGIRWAGDCRVRAKSLSPFYADPIELLYAVRHAVVQGATQLEKSLELLNRMPWTTEQANHILERPICSSAYGSVVWKSENLQKLRQLANKTPVHSLSET